MCHYPTGSKMTRQWACRALCLHRVQNSMVLRHGSFNFFWLPVDAIPVPYIQIALGECFFSVLQYQVPGMYVSQRNTFGFKLIITQHLLHHLFWYPSFTKEHNSVKNQWLEWLQVWKIYTDYARNVAVIFSNLFSENSLTSMEMCGHLLNGNFTKVPDSRNRFWLVEGRKKYVKNVR